MKRCVSQMVEAHRIVVVMLEYVGIQTPDFPLIHLKKVNF